MSCRWRWSFDRGRPDLCFRHQQGSGGRFARAWAAIRAIWRIFRPRPLPLAPGSDFPSELRKHTELPLRFIYQPFSPRDFAPDLTRTAGDTGAPQSPERRIESRSLFRVFCRGGFAGHWAAAAAAAKTVATMKLGLALLQLAATAAAATSPRAAGSARSTPGALLCGGACYTTYYS